MEDWITELPKGGYVLDLGSGAGTLRSLTYSCTVVLLDCDPGALLQLRYSKSTIHPVIAAGNILPFSSSVFDVVLCSHVLEHVGDLDSAFSEISRVLKPAGRFYVAVPNGYGMCDGLYRFIFEGGDHVNRFRCGELVEMVENKVSVRLTKWQRLYSSFAYLSRLSDLSEEILPSLPPRLRRVASLPSFVPKLFQAFLYVTTRMADRSAPLDWALYGWAFYFERTCSTALTEEPPFVNVCLHCGSGHPACQLTRRFKVLYRCPSCGRTGIYFPPFRQGQ